MNRDHSVSFEITPKYCISDSFVGYDEVSEVVQFYEDLQDLLELIPKNDVLFIKGTGMQK